MPGIQKEYLGFDGPPLASAVALLRGRYLREGCFDLERVAIVVPTSQAMRRLREMLVQAAEREEAALLPPEIVTPGQLPELLYEPRLAFAGTLVQQLVWARALRELPEAQRAVLLAAPPAADDEPAWLDLGGLIARQHAELAGEGLDFAAVAASDEVRRAGEQARWQTLAAAQRRYLTILDGLRLWDRQTARRVAVERGECTLAGDLYLLATTDIPRVDRQMLDQAAARSPTARIAALIYAPAAWAERFDDHGCVLPEAWLEAPLAFDDAHLHLAEGPTQQAEEVVRRIAAYGGRFRGDQIAVGLPDERMAPLVERQLRLAGLPARYGPGVPLAASPPLRLLELAGQYAAGGWYADFAALVRHAHVGDWLRRQGVAGDYCTALDQFYGERFPARLGNRWPADRSAGLVQMVTERVNAWLRPLHGKKRLLCAWREPLLKVLDDIYRDRPAGVAYEAEWWDACETIGAALSEFERVPAEFAPHLTAAEAIALVVRMLARERQAPPADPTAIDLSGWLELLLDDSAALIVVGLHDGLLPTAANSDLFLPNALRAKLGMHDNARRYARDAYACAALNASGRAVDWIVGRRSVDDDPVLPSRLLFAADDATVLRRAERFFGEREALRPPPLASARRAARAVADFPIPKPDPERGLEALSATGFREYLACPYRFYLRRVLRLQSLDDVAEELDGAAFGTLLHGALDAFGRGPARHATDPRAIQEALFAALDQLADELFGGEAIAAVRLQVEQARTRLARFAESQADWARQGWQIEATEMGFRAGDSNVALEVDGRRLLLSGRIDRVDRHLETGRRAILDYKTSDRAQTPQQTHRTRDGDWIDLQLPLYRHLVRGLNLGEEFVLGYILLPRDGAQASFELAAWSADELAAADDLARQIARDVLDRKFWPPRYPAEFADDLAAICQDNVFGLRPPGLGEEIAASE